MQEALTNVRKHAPGTAVTVDVAGSTADGLVVGVRNAAPVGRQQPRRSPRPASACWAWPSGRPCAGGRISHGTDPGGGYAVRAWIPWDT